MNNKIVWFALQCLWDFLLSSFLSVQYVFLSFFCKPTVFQTAAGTLWKLYCNITGIAVLHAHADCWNECLVIMSPFLCYFLHHYTRTISGWCDGGDHPECLYSFTARFCFWFLILFFHPYFTPGLIFCDFQRRQRQKLKLYFDKRDSWWNGYGWNMWVREEWMVKW